MTWRLAASLDGLRKQINALSPNRSKVSDGTIGDTAHSNRKSDHNPDGDGIVRALDITHDPAHGIHSHKLALALVESRDPRISYIISNGKIVSGASGKQPWVWRNYTGKNPHNHHVHISVVPGAKGDAKGTWHFGMGVSPGEVAAPVVQPRLPVLQLGSEGPEVAKLQKLLGVTADGQFGHKTEATVRAFQKKKKLVADGKVGPQTWSALGA